MERLFDLQIFADDEVAANHSEADAEKGASNGAAGAEDKPAEPKAKYSDEDVDALIQRKFAEWQKKQEKKTSEAERLGRMTAEEKANERMKALEDRIREYEQRESRAEMTKAARAMLQEKNINISDGLLTYIIADNADDTKANAEEFIALYQKDVERAVKEALKGEPPRKGGTSGLTKEQILGVQNRAERQRLINENMHLFK